MCERSIQTPTGQFRVEKKLFKNLGLAISDEEHHSFVGTASRETWLYIMVINSFSEINYQTGIIALSFDKFGGAYLTYHNFVSKLTKDFLQPILFNKLVRQAGKEDYQSKNRQGRRR